MIYDACVVIVNKNAFICMFYDMCVVFVNTTFTDIIICIIAA